MTHFEKKHHEAVVSSAEMAGALQMLILMKNIATSDPAIPIAADLARRFIHRLTLPDAKLLSSAWLEQQVPQSREVLESDQSGRTVLQHPPVDSLEPERLLQRRGILRQVMRSGLYMPNVHSPDYCPPEDETAIDWKSRYEAPEELVAEIDRVERRSFWAVVLSLIALVCSVISMIIGVVLAK